MGSQLVLWMPEKRVGCVLRSTLPRFLDGPQLLLWACPEEGGRRGMERRTEEKKEEEGRDARREEKRKEVRREG